MFFNTLDRRVFDGGEDAFNWKDIEWIGWDGHAGNKGCDQSIFVLNLWQGSNLITFRRIVFPRQAVLTGANSGSTPKINKWSLSSDRSSAEGVVKSNWKITVAPFLLCTEYWRNPIRSCRSPSLKLKIDNISTQ